MVARAGTGSSMLPCWYWRADDPQMIHLRKLMLCRKGPLMWVILRKTLLVQQTSESSGGGERSETVGQALALYLLRP